MTRPTTRSRRVASAIPLVLLSTAWTTHLAGALPATTGAAATTEPRADRTLPDGTRMPGAAIDYPASLSQPDEVSAAGDTAFAQVVATPSADDIPASALAAYQRAESVINAADTTCALGWQLIAAIGRVESDHGRFGASTLDSDGVATPAIVGLVLDGRNGTAQINDTDAGQLDADTRFDRAVGPLQFIPSTWAVVGVDADDDGTRDPQDIDDAALAAAVYLCSGDDDLSQDAGRREAVFRYNNSDAYVDMVLSIMDGYLAGDYASWSAPPISAGFLVPPTGPTAADVVPSATVHTVQLGEPVDLTPSVGGSFAVGEPTLVGASGVGEPTGSGELQPEAPSVEPTDEPTDEPSVPSDEPTDEPSVPSDEPTDEPTDEPSNPTDEPTDEPTDPSGEPAEDPTEPAPVDPGTDEPLPGSMSAEAADVHCLDLGYVDDVTLTDDEYDVCLVTYTADPADPAAPGQPSSTEPEPAVAGRRDQ